MNRPRPVVDHDPLMTRLADRFSRNMAQAMRRSAGHCFHESARQNQTRTFMAHLGYVWRHTMSPAEQNSFLLIGQHMPDKNGRPMAPFQAFVKVHCLRRSAGWLEVLTIAPSSATFPVGATGPVGGVPQGGEREQGGEQEIGPAYAARYGVPAAGMKVVVRVRVINAAGCAGGWTLAEAVVQASPAKQTHPLPTEEGSRIDCSNTPPASGDAALRHTPYCEGGTPHREGGRGNGHSRAP